MEIPINTRINTILLSSVFNNTAATYKYYWFLSLLEIFSEKQEVKIPIRNILARMICNAWYPVHYFKLSFGFADMLSNNIKAIQQISGLPYDINKNDLYQWLIDNKDRRILKLVDHFSKQVPFRFLSPWLPSQTDKNIVILSHSFKNNCLYRIIREEKIIEINPDWTDYLHENRKILEDFCYWNLGLYLQSKNPNTPDIPNKLIKPYNRSSLNKQRSFWKIAFSENQLISCIYTDRLLTSDDFAVEHFIPYSFVSHDLLWNLIPADRTINISKSNKIPDLKVYLKDFTRIQKIGISAVYLKSPHHKMLEDYLALVSSIPEILNLSEHKLQEMFYDHLSPLAQIAINMGFEVWNYNSIKS